VHVICGFLWDYAIAWYWAWRHIAGRLYRSLSTLSVFRKINPAETAW
jgi:hypothetical protein